ncbi:hypothetical protein [Ferrovibrio sp.]|uniref:hypothetical protein n=1 Tax=Ferrovibrio sp. TaxID=1917215 RepID=UPI001B4F8DC4|nr:hypothetical protein [Ferrovibrio sp.]MBP7062808.1 hypothetical protein [Ferrovibrio sp.]
MPTASLTMPTGNLHANPVLHAALLYWLSLPKAHDEALPDFLHIDAETIPHDILPHLLIAEMSDADFDHGHYLLAGTEIKRWFRLPPEGLDVDHAARITPAGYIDHMYEIARDLVARRMPLHVQTKFLQPHQPPVISESVVMPLTRGGDKVECVMIVQVFHSPGAAANAPAPEPHALLPPGADVMVEYSPIRPAY